MRCRVRRRRGGARHELGILLPVGANQAGIESQRPGCPLHQFVSADPLTTRDMHDPASLVLRQATAHLCLDLILEE